MTTNIIIAGDFCPKDRVAHLVECGSYEAIFSEVKPVVEKADYAIVNLEAPIVHGKGTPIRKSGPNLKCGVRTIEAILYAGFKGVTLANNHFRDYGDEGAQSTIEELEKANIDHVGAGQGTLGACRTLYKEIGGCKFAFINCCEHEFSVTEADGQTGCNGLDVISQYHAIHEARKQAQRVVVIVHGGIEMYQLPTPRMVRTYRFFIEAGADAVVNHHQHCFSGYEYYMNKPIIYGLGNFCFDWDGKRDPIWKDGLMASLVFDDGGKVSFEPIPYRQCDILPAVLTSAIDKEQFSQRLHELCGIIADENALRAEYDRLLDRTWRNYDMMTPWHNRYLRYLYKHGLLPSLMPRKKLLSILNAVRCESHHERLTDALQRKINN